MFQASATGVTLFDHDAHYALFERLLAGALRRTEAKALAFCWLPRAVHLALQVGYAPLGRTMQALTSSYARIVHRERGASGHLFADRYRGLLLDPTEWLLPLVRYIHYQPVLSGLTARPAHWPHSSHFAYLGERRAAFLFKRPVLELLEVKQQGPQAYAELMRTPPSDVEVRAIASGGNDPRMLGVLSSINGRHGMRLPRPKLTLDQIIDQVVRMLEVDRVLVLSKSRKHSAALARAVIAWYATERGVTTLTDVSRRLGRDPSTLSLAIDRHRRRRPELFNLAAYAQLKPLS